MCTEKATEKIRLRSLHIMNLLICFFLLASNNPFNRLTQLSCCSFRAPLGAFSCELIKLSDLYWAVFPLFPIISVRTAVIVVCFICPNCLSLRDNAACCIPLRHLRDLRENIHPNLLNQTTQKKPQCLPQISQIYADKPQNNKTALTSPNSSLSATSAGE